jgi:peroxiredoxin
MIRFCLRQAIARIAVVAAGAALLYPARLNAQKNAPVWSDEEKPIYVQIRGLRELSDDARASTTKSLAIQIRGLSNSPNRLLLANLLANPSTEGDPGLDTLQEVATTLADALSEHPLPALQGRPAMAYMELAALVRFEHVQVSLDNPQFTEALDAIDAAQVTREQADFTLTDLEGKNWELQGLRGQVVLVNFWATWCPASRREMPELDALYQRFKDQGLVVLAITNEDAGRTAPFIAARHISFPILLDPDAKVNQLFQIQAIPMSFVYDRDGKLVAEAMNMRIEAQFMKMLAQAGLQ